MQGSGTHAFGGGRKGNRDSRHGQSVVEAGKIKEQDFESIVAAILKREELGSTGIGRGVAVPHTKHPAVDKLVGTVAISDEGVDFDSLDGEKVHLLFLLISPPDRPGDRLRALENISRQLRDDTFCRFLKQSKTPNDVWQLLEEGDNNQAASSAIALSSTRASEDRSASTHPDGGLLADCGRRVLVMSTFPVTRTVVIVNTEGLHAGRQTCWPARP